MNSNRPSVDAMLLRVLTGIPGFELWANQPMDPAIRAMIEKADLQEILSVTAVCVRLILLHRQHQVPLPIGKLDSIS